MIRILNPNQCSTVTCSSPMEPSNGASGVGGVRGLSVEYMWVNQGA